MMRSNPNHFVLVFFVRVVVVVVLIYLAINIGLVWSVSYYVTILEANVVVVVIVVIIVVVAIVLVVVVVIFIANVVVLDLLVVADPTISSCVNLMISTQMILSS